MWRCPHCGAPQAETARCWVCRRSSTTCSTCKNFQRSLASDLGYCGLDARRRPLTGLELRGCWEARPAVVQEPASLPPPEVHRLRRGVAARDARDARVPRGFVPLELLDGTAVDPGTRRGPRAESDSTSPSTEIQEDPAVAEATVIPVAELMDDWSERRSLFGDAEA